MDEEFGLAGLCCGDSAGAAGAGDVEEGVGGGVEEVVEDEGVDVEEGLWIRRLFCHGGMGTDFIRRGNAEIQKAGNAEEVKRRS